MPSAFLSKPGRETQHTGEGEPHRLHRDRASADATAVPAAAPAARGRMARKAERCARLGVGPGQHPVEEQVVRRHRAAQSCSDRTPMSPRRSASMPCTAAASPCTVVMHGTLLSTAAVRIS